MSLEEFEDKPDDGSSQLNIAKTICRDCIFRGETLEMLPSQNGEGHYCTINKLNKDKAQFNKENQYWSLNYFCNSCRNKDWLKANNLLDANEDTILKTIRKENTVKSDLIFLFHQNHLLEDIERTLDKVDATYVSNVLISINNRKIRPSQINKLMQKYRFHWQLNYNLEDIGLELQIVKLHKHTKGMFSIIVDKMTLFNSDLPRQLDVLVNDKNEKFVLWQTEDEETSNLVIHNIMYNMVKTIDIKIIKDFAEGQKCLHMLKLKNK